MNKKKKFVVYTVMVGGYDEVYQPIAVDDRFDYILFTDVIEQEEIGVWQVRSFPYHNEDKAQMSRYPKMHPEELLSEYEASLYIDANVQIKNNDLYEKCISLYNDDIEWGGIYMKDSLYEEALTMLLVGFERPRKIINWCHHIKKEHYPRYYDVYWNNVIFRRHNDNTTKIDSLWWNLFDTYAHRDQLFLSYCFWKLPLLKKNLLYPLHGTKWYNYTNLIPHKNDRKRIKSKVNNILGKVSLYLIASFGGYKRCANEFFYRICSLNVFFAQVMLEIFLFLIFVLFGSYVFFKKALKRLR